MPQFVGQVLLLRRSAHDDDTSPTLESVLVDASLAKATVAIPTATGVGTDAKAVETELAPRGATVTVHAGLPGAARRVRATVINTRVATQMLDPG